MRGIWLQVNSRPDLDRRACKLRGNKLSSGITFEIRAIVRAALLEMVMEILTLMRNLPRTSCLIVSKTWKKKFRKIIGMFIINAKEILPYVKISHETIFFW
jgi:hypothetical protein